MKMWIYRVDAQWTSSQRVSWDFSVRFVSTLGPVKTWLNKSCPGLCFAGPIKNIITHCFCGKTVSGHTSGETQPNWAELSRIPQFDICIIFSTSAAALSENPCLFRDGARARPINNTPSFLHPLLPSAPSPSCSWCIVGNGSRRSSSSPGPRLLL